MDVRKLTVIRVQLPRDSLVQVGLNCAENRRMFKRLDSEIEDDDSHSARKYLQ